MNWRRASLQLQVAKYTVTTRNQTEADNWRIFKTRNDDETKIYKGK